MLADVGGSNVDLRTRKPLHGAAVGTEVGPDIDGLEVDGVVGLLALESSAEVLVERRCVVRLEPDLVPVDIRGIEHAGDLSIVNMVYKLRDIRLLTLDLPERDLLRVLLDLHVLLLALLVLFASHIGRNCEI